MAQQKGIKPIKGTIGNMTFYKSGGEHLVREKTDIDGSRIMTDPKYARTAENCSEFGRAGLSGKLVRTALRSLTTNASDRYMIARLTQRMMTVIHADLTSSRGKRNVIDGETELLTGFDFNDKSPLSTTIFAPFTTVIDRVAGTLGVNFPSFNPGTMIAAPQGATHFRINSAGLEVDFEGKTYVVDIHQSAQFPLDGGPTAAINQSNAVTANSTHPLFVVAGIEFFQEVNGTMYLLSNRAYNALSIVNVSGV